MASIALKRFALGFGTCAIFRIAEAGQVLLTLDAGRIAGLQEIPVLAPVPMSGAWQGGQTMRVAGMIAQDILNSDQLIIPGYYLNHTWLDDTCQRDNAVRTALSAWNSRSDWLSLGAHGCSADCIATAPAASALRIPIVAYGCSSVVLASAQDFPHFSRMMGSEGDYVNGFAALAGRFGWERISVMSGLPARWDRTAAYMTEALQGLGYDAVRVGPDSRAPSWEDMLAVMTDMKRMASRVIVVMMYSPDMAKMACAAKVAGMPRGIVWLYHAGNAPVNFFTHGADLVDFDSSCTPEAVQPYWEGSIGVTDHGRPATDAMLDRPLDCFPNYTAREFHQMLDRWLVSGYPEGENTITNINSVIQGNAVDGTCIWAFLVRHMLSQSYTLQQLQRPSDAVFQEMIRYMKEDLDFHGVVGRVKFNGSPNIQHTLSIKQVQNGQLDDIELYDQGAQTFVQIENKTLVWGDGNSTPTSYFAFCPEGTQLTSLATCQPCSEGNYYEPVLRACIECQSGRAKGFTGGVGWQQCAACPEGFHANSSGMSACVRCPEGHFSGTSGQAECEPCAAGRFGPGEGLASCGACGIGAYQNSTGAVMCESCEAVLVGSITPFLGASRPGQCACPVGSYTFGTECRGCSTGLRCGTGGLGEPRQEEGYKVERVGGSAASLDVEVSVYRCRSAGDCPAGDLGTCAPGHTGTACGTCLDGYFKSGAGECKDCASGTDLGVTVAVAAILVVLGVCAFIAVIRNGTKERTTTVTAALAVGQLVFALQTMGVYRQMTILWPEPILSVLSVLQVFSFDVEVLRYSCVVGSNDIVSQFAFQLGGVPCIVVMLALLTKIAGAFRGERKFDLVQFSNLVGLLMIICYVTLAVAMMQPLYCVRHPNGKRSMVSSYSVLCWESPEHTALVVMSVVGTLAYPVSLLAVIGAVTWKYPALVASGRGMRVASFFNFLFKRFTPRGYFWGFFYLLRNLLVAATPVVVPDSASWQVLIVSTVFILGLSCEAYLFPWRTTLANVSNIICLSSLLIFLQTAAALIVVEDTKLIGTVLCVLLLALVVALLCFAAYGVAGFLFPGNKYDVFLCHHKDGAGSFARWMKIQILAKKPGALVFLDSDCLEELDLIVDIVATRTKRLAVLLSRLVLTRPWCAAELTSAAQSKVPVVKVQLEDHEERGKGEIDGLMSGWSEEQKVDLARYGITPALVKEAFAGIWDQASLPFDRLGSRTLQSTSLADVLKALTGAPSATGAGALADPAGTGAKVVVLGASMDAEARSTCEVMALLLQKQLEAEVAAVHSTADVPLHSGSALYMMVMITRGLLQDDTFMGLLLALTGLARNVPVEIVTALADSNFCFPTPKSLAEMVPERGSALKKVFNILALPFSSLGSATIQGVQVSEIARRFSKLDRAVVLLDGPAEAKGWEKATSPAGNEAGEGNGASGPGPEDNGAGGGGDVVRHTIGV